MLSNEQTRPVFMMCLVSEPVRHTAKHNINNFYCHMSYLTIRNVFDHSVTISFKTCTVVCFTYNIFSSFYPFAFITGLSVYSQYYSALDFPFKHFFSFSLAHVGERIVVCSDMICLN
jgi:hypothetical protein